MRVLLYIVMFALLLLLCSCRSSHSAVSETEFATDSIATLRQSRWQTSTIDSVWQSTELTIDSCFVIFNQVAQPDSSLFQKTKTVRIYGAHLTNNRKQCVNTEKSGEDTLAMARKSTVSKAEHMEKSAKQYRFSSVKLCLSLVSLVALAAFWWVKRRHISDA